MTSRDPKTGILAEALEMLERADRLHRQFFRIGRSQVSYPTWEPPVDIFETEHELVILVALPGVAAEHTQVTVDAGDLVVAGDRHLPGALRNAVVRQLEIPYGRFERRIELPPGHFEIHQRAVVDGCLVLSLLKLA